MTSQEREEMDRLCRLIAVEKDPTKFDEYVRQLDALLEVKRVRIHPEHKIKAN